MRKKMGTKSSTKTGKAWRKIADLAPKHVKGGAAAAVKGGAIDIFAKIGDIKGESIDDTHKV